MRVNKASYKTKKKNKWHLYVTAAFLVYFGICTYLFLNLSSIEHGHGIYAGNTPTEILQPVNSDTSFNYNEYPLPYYQEVQIPVTEEIMLNGWHIKAEEPQPVIIIVSGKDSTKADPRMIVVAGMLWKHGFDVLLVDHRNQGNSTKTHGRTSLGTEEYDDILASIQWLTHKNYTESQIGLMGCSLGAVINAIAFSENENIPALFLDSPFSEPQQMIKDELKRRHIPRFFMKGSLWIGKVVFGQDLTKKSTFNALKSLSDRSLFITHSNKDNYVKVKHSQHLLDHAGLHANAYIDHWFHNYNGHCTAMIQAPHEYEDHLANFFIQSLKKSSGHL